MATTTLTPEQIIEAERFLKEKAEESHKAAMAKIQAKLKAVAERMVEEALACPGVVAAQVTKYGSAYSSGIDITYAGQRSMERPEGYVSAQLEGYHPDCSVKIVAKYKPGYKSGFKKFKSVRNAVKANRTFILDIQAQVDAYMASEAAKKAVAK